MVGLSCIERCANSEVDIYTVLHRYTVGTADSALVRKLKSPLFGVTFIERFHCTTYFSILWACAHVHVTSMRSGVPNLRKGCVYIMRGYDTPALYIADSHA